MKCTQVNLLPVANKQNQTEFMQKPSIQSSVQLRVHTIQMAVRPSRLNIYRMHITINIFPNRMETQVTLQSRRQIDILSSLFRGCLSMLFCQANEVSARERERTIFFSFFLSFMFVSVGILAHLIRTSVCIYFVSVGKFMDLSVGKYQTTLMVHTQQTYIQLVKQMKCFLAIIKQLTTTATVGWARRARSVLYRYGRRIHRHLEIGKTTCALNSREREGKDE